jgi:DNA-binding NarL/FixJ family response regulator
VQGARPSSDAAGEVELARRFGAPQALGRSLRILGLVSPGDGVGQLREAVDVLAGVESLTPSERRVAGMAADGTANKVIAQTLYVTPKTVELHLSSAYRKLGIRSRRELPAALVPR